jgi:hypothetical protein
MISLIVRELHFTLAFLLYHFTAAAVVCAVTAAAVVCAVTDATAHEADAVLNDGGL